MQLRIQINTIKKIGYVVAILFFISVLFFCTWYLASDYDQLVQWYYRLNPCFYRSKYWANDFFTTRIKANGNLYCIAAIGVAIGGLLWLGFKSRKKHQLPQKAAIQYKPDSLLQYGLCIISSTVLWFWADSLAVPSNDEVFSALNCAGIHPFQTVSYYMLPNNHMLFNLLNNVIFHACENKVVTARILSLFFYWLLSVTFFSFFKKLLGNKWLALFVALTLSLQFPIWGFGCQGRGYELLALTEWITFIAFVKYILYQEKKWLYVMLIAISAGYFTIPVFLYFHVAILLFAFCLQISKKKIDWQFWIAQIVTGAVVYLLYVPCFCFSGLQSITANPWSSVTQSYPQLWADLVPTWQNFMDYCFSNIGRVNYWADLVLFLFPFSLLFYKQNFTAQLFGWFYCCLWITLALLTIKMKTYPIDRALPGQFSITLALVVYAVYLFVEQIADKTKGKYVLIALPIILLLMDINYLDRNREYITHYQCHFHVNEWEELVANTIKTSIPAGSTVALSDESFYWYYLCKNYGYNVHKCAQGSEQYLIKSDGEPFLWGKPDDFILLNQQLLNYRLYKRR